MAEYYEFKTVFEKFLFNCSLATFNSCCEVFLETVPGNFNVQCVIFSKESHVEVKDDPAVDPHHVETFKDGLLILKGLLRQVADSAPKNFTLTIALIGDIDDCNKMKSAFSYQEVDE